MSELIVRPAARQSARLLIGQIAVMTGLSPEAVRRIEIRARHKLNYRVKRIIALQETAL